MRRRRQVRILLTPATNEEYDHMLATAPELCRPLAAAMGDLRPAARCIDDYGADQAIGVAGLMGTEPGRRAASLLADAIAGRFRALMASNSGGRRRVPLEVGSLP